MIRVGTSGFSFRDWVGTVYPPDLKKEETLLYYAEHMGFDTVEINATYYTLVSEKSFDSMERKTPGNFMFTVKAFRGTTHDPFDDRLGGRRLSVSDAQEKTLRFASSLAPLKSAGKLGAVLLQWPVFFSPRQETKDYLLFCQEWLKGLPLVVEFRNRAWATPETFEWLRSRSLGSCTVDEPKHPRLMPFINEVTSPIGYMRFHGRNPHWFGASLEERYDYDYSEAELKTFIPEIRKAAAQTQDLYVFFNNCHKGAALRNANALKGLLGQSCLKS